MPRYQILEITLDKGNPVFLPHAIELSANTVSEAGERLAESLFELGVNVKGIKTLVRTEIEERWEMGAEKPNLFNNGGEDPEALPKKRRGRPAGAKNKPKDERTRFDGLLYGE